MTIITLDTCNREKIVKLLRQIAKDVEKNWNFQESSNPDDNTQFEIKMLPEQRFEWMNHFLHFQENSNQLKLVPQPLRDGYYIKCTTNSEIVQDGFPNYEEANEWLKNQLKVDGIFESMTPNEFEIYKK